MSSCLYVAAWDMDASDGITKKIESQIMALESLYDNCDYVIFGNGGKFKNVNKGDYDFVYVRNCNGLKTLNIIKLLLSIKAKKVVYEIPTFPYWGEISSFKSRLEYIFKKYTLKFFVDEIVYIGKYHKSKIWSVKSREITNCISEPREKYPLIESTLEGAKVNIVGVASQAVWHGYDRLIKGLIGKNYDCVNFHIVGHGPAMKELQNLVTKNNLQNSVIFHGKLEGEELYSLLSKMDCGIDSLGRHRVGIKYNSSLKAKEYLSFGLPVVMSHIDSSIIQNDFVLKVKDDESNIDINEILDFYKKFKGGKKVIQDFAYANFSWEEQFINIIDS